MYTRRYLLASKVAEVFLKHAQKQNMEKCIPSPKEMLLLLYTDFSFYNPFPIFLKSRIWEAQVFEEHFCLQKVKESFFIK